MSKYKIILFNSWGDNKVEFSNSWLWCKIRILWLEITGRSAVWVEKKRRRKNDKRLSCWR